MDMLAVINLSFDIMRSMRARPLMDRFFEKIAPEPNSGCWLWAASTKSWGYGQIGQRIGRPLAAHRVSYEYFKGPIPDGIHVCHKCDIPACVNPDHLFLGTHKDNMQDAVNKRKKHKKIIMKDKEARLSPSAKQSIYRSPERPARLAKRFGISKKCVYEIRNDHQLWQSQET